MKEKSLPDVREALQHNYYTALKEASQQFPPDTSMNMLVAYALTKSAVKHCIDRGITMYCTFSPEEGSSLATGNVSMCSKSYACELIDSLAYLYDLEPEAADKFCVEAMAALNQLMMQTPKDVSAH